MPTATLTITPTAKPSDYVKAKAALGRKLKDGIAIVKAFGLKKGGVLYPDTNVIYTSLDAVMERCYKEAQAAPAVGRGSGKRHTNVRHQPRKLRIVTATKIIATWKAQLEHDRSRIGRDDAVAELLLEKLEALIEYGESMLLAATKGDAITRSSSAKERVV